VTDDPHLPEPYEGFDLQVVVDRVVYAPGETVRISVSATNHADRFVEHHYPGWQRYELTIHDETHRAVSDDNLDRDASTPAIDRWLPGQHVIWPTYWTQTSGPIVPARVPGGVPGPAVAPGRYRPRVVWLGREPDVRQRPPDVWGPWFELT
jgi:hypothetical protein